ncbi:hypothetical protein BGX34_008653, partial [Mortierella sp. NVP85]
MKASKRLPATTGKNLSKLDEFLAETKNQPMIRQPDHAVTASSSSSSSSSWRIIPSIKKLFWVEACLFDLDQLCLPTELMQYVIPDHQSELSSTVASTQSDGTSTSTVRADLDYKSPLT